MGLYNMVFGVSKNAGNLLNALGLQSNHFYRFRDCYLTENNQIAVYTRAGGGNRDCYCNEAIGLTATDKDGDKHTEVCVVIINEHLRAHPLYITDEDDAFDSTYATYYFKVPDNVDVSHIPPEKSRNEQWVEYLEALKKAADEEKKQT
jgi:hypothetical protein